MTQKSNSVNILLVDDNDDILLTTETILDNMGLNIVKAHSGKEALDLMKKQEFAVVLLDVCLPDLSGFETAAVMRMQVHTYRTPIIFFSGIMKEDSNIAMGYQLGAVDYILKPFNPDMLRLKVQIFANLSRQKEKTQSYQRGMNHLIKQPTVLLVHDDEIQLKFMEESISSLNVNILKAKNGKEALGYLMGMTEVSLILLDIHIQDMDGFEIAKIIRQTHYLCHIPIIFITTFDKINKDVTLGYSYEPIDFIATPVESNIFRNKVAAICNIFTHYKLLEEEKREIERLNKELWVLNDTLEQKVIERTAEMKQAYNDLCQVQKVILQQHQMQALGQLASGAVHEIGNALAVITAHTEILLEESNIPLEERKQLEFIKTAGEDIANILNRLRQFYYKPKERGKITFVDMNKIVQQVIDIMEPIWKNISQEKGISIDRQTNLQKDLPAVMGNENEIREVLINLVLNAIDAMPQGGVITFGTMATLTNVIFEIIDTGIGMDEETMEHCLEPLYTTKGELGTGLGLAVVQEIVRRHKGEIQIESELNKGTIIRLLFPLGQKIEDRSQMSEVRS